VSDSARKNAGVRVFHVGDDPLSVLPLLKHVKGGGCLALQLDRIPRGMRSQSTEFFGFPWQCPLGPFQLAKAAKVPVVPIFTARRAFLHHYIEVGEPIAFDDDRAAEKAMRAAEGFIRRFPTQWFHFVAHSM
jgi:KDO2-lipid IV(A) lauroyltransferase